MKMQITGSPFSVGLQPVKTVPYMLVSELQLTVNLVLVPIVTVLAATTASYTIYMINRSAGAHIIRVGAAPSFGPVAGISLLATDADTLWNVGQSIFAICDLAGGLLDVQVWQQG